MTWLPSSETATVGAMLAGRLARRFGLGPVLGAVQILTGAARVAIPLAVWIGPAVLVLAAGELALGVIRAVFNVNQISLRQAVTPDHQLGRTTASIGFLMWGAVPFGALLGGWLGMAVGLLSTLAIGIAGTFAASLWIYVSSEVRGRSYRDVSHAPETSSARLDMVHS